MQIEDFVPRALRDRVPLFSPKAPAGKRPAPTLSGGLPLVGHSVEFLRSTLDLLFRAQRELGEVAAFTVFNRKMVALFGPEAHEAVFRAPDTVLSPSEAYKIMTPVFGKDIVYDAPPAKMAEQLKMLLPALQDRRMRTYGEAVVYETEQTIERWGDSGTVDLVDFCRVLTNFTSSRCLLGREFREGMNEEFAAVYHDLERGVTPIAYVNAHLPIPSFIKRDRARVRMVEMITRIIEARRREKREGEDFLQTLMDSRYKDGRALSEDEITGLLLAGMFAGHHTSSVTTAWTLLDLLSNRHTYDLARAEIDRVFGSGEPVSHAKLRELTYVENAVKESLRLHPPLFMLVRVAQEDWTYKEWFFPKGTWLVVSPTVAHRMAEVFPDPDAYQPERFAPPREEDKRDFAFIAFGGGRHKCLGNAFALLQVKAILALLIGQYDFDLAGDATTADFHGLVIGPKEPCRLRYRRRADPSVTTAAAARLKTLANESPEEVAARAAAGGCPAHAHAGAKGATATDASPTTKTGPVRLHLDRDLCQGHGVCVGEAPEIFSLAKDGRVQASGERFEGALADKVRKAARYCPTHTLRVEEE